MRMSGDAIATRLRKVRIATRSKTGAGFGTSQCARNHNAVPCAWHLWSPHYQENNIMTG
jgi:hypothetical protein